MSSPAISTKRRLIFILFSVMMIVLLLMVRLIQIQIVQADKLKKEVFDQWSRDIPIRAKRGEIYDRNGKILATNISLETVWCRPADVSDPENTAEKLSKVLEMDIEKIHNKITKKQSLLVIKRGIKKSQADALRVMNLNGIEIVTDNKRYYPFDNFASYIIGHTNADNIGQYGIERVYNKYLTGKSGRYMRTVDARGKEMPYKDENIIEPVDGFGLVLTIDEVIQHIAENAAYEALVKNKAKKVSIIVMDPNNGDVLALAQKPDYNPNSRNSILYNPESPWILNDENIVEMWENAKWQDKEKYVYENWKNFSINSIYEPGSTFKIITGIAGLEEKVVTPESKFHCDGFVRQVKSNKPIKCWRYYRPHGSQNFVEGAQNSCNEVFVEIGLRLGPEKMYKYIKDFGFGEKTGINLTGEISGIIPYSSKAIKEVNLATISFGQGIAVTPIQLITAVSSIGNDGNLMEPRIVKELVNSDNEIIKKFDPVTKRQVVSKETADTMLEILKTVVSDGTGRKAYVAGYRVGGKTGTAQKVVNGRYASGKYIASFTALAPVDNPKIAVLVIIDEPTNGIYYGGQIAAPVAGQIINSTLDYLNTKPIYSKKDIEKGVGIVVEVPDLKNKTLKEASRILNKIGLKYSTETTDNANENIIKEQFPSPGVNINKGQIVYLYVNGNN